MKRTNENVAPVYDEAHDNIFSIYETKSNVKRTKFTDPLETNNNNTSEAEYDDQESITTNNTNSYHNNHSNNHNNNINNNNDNDDEKPVPGSAEWLKLRRLTHSEVERRRRKAMSEKIEELAKLINTRETKKGMILRNAINYIHTINDKFKQEEEKYTLEKLAAEETMKLLQYQVEDFKARYKKCRELNRELCAKVGKEFEESDDDDGEERDKGNSY
ncbi:hypothetical protein BJ944DRAFT_290878 [Cunninghamella echinulata]|nr:hypothetical protein BJ944DRAFT_290878 [Cunninghamella echinulata]